MLDTCLGECPTTHRAFEHTCHGGRRWRCEGELAHVANWPKFYTKFNLWWGAVAVLTAPDLPPYSSPLTARLSLHLVAFISARSCCACFSSLAHHFKQVPSFLVMLVLASMSSAHHPLSLGAPLQAGAVRHRASRSPLLRFCLRRSWRVL